MSLRRFLERRAQEKNEMTEPKSKDSSEDRQERERAAARALADSTALSVFADACNKQMEELIEFRKKHEEDIKSHEISFRRWGDFLAVFAERFGEKVIVSIPLGNCSRVELVEGDEPNLKGHRLPRFWVKDTETGRINPWGGYYLPLKNEVLSADYELEYSLPEVIIRNTKDPLDIFRFSGYFEPYHMACYRTNHAITCAAQPATDDKILFVGTGTEIWLPQGIGKAAFDALMVETSRYFQETK